MKLLAVISLTQVTVVTAIVNYPELQLCTTEDGQPGVRCGQKCLWSGGWCRDDLSAICSTRATQFSTREASLCRNTTFWSTVDCNVYYSDGEVALYGKRCSANKQHCYYPWYTKNTQDFEDKETEYLPNCQDHSDRIFELNTRCNIIEYVKEYSDTICNKINKHKYCKDNICENPARWVSHQTDSFILDPHNCESSCQNPSRVCNACTNKKDYFTCMRSGVCIHRDLFCDGHKHCKYGEDEDSGDCHLTYTENSNSNNNNIIFDNSINKTNLNSNNITFLNIVTAHNVFYAVEDVDSKKFSIFSPISHCRIFVNMENKVMYKLGNNKWKIGRITRNAISKYFSKTCSDLVDILNIKNEYKLNGNRIADISYWKNLEDKDGRNVKIRTRKILRNEIKWSLKLIEGIRNSSSTWEECQNLVLDFYKTKSTKIIVSFEENAEECFHSDDFRVKLKHNNNAYVRILESNPYENLITKIIDEVEEVVGGQTTPISDITDKTIDITDDTMNSASVNVTLYTSIGLGGLAIIMLGLIILIVVKLRKQNVPVTFTYEYYLGKIYNLYLRILPVYTS